MLLLQPLNETIGVHSCYSFTNNYNIGSSFDFEFEIVYIYLVFDKIVQKQHTQFYLDANAKQL